jgi:hypothetical protein
VAQVKALGDEREHFAQSKVMEVSEVRERDMIDIELTLEEIEELLREVDNYLTSAK